MVMNLQIWLSAHLLALARIWLRIVEAPAMKEKGLHVRLQPCDQTENSPRLLEHCSLVNPIERRELRCGFILIRVREAYRILRTIAD